MSLNVATLHQNVEVFCTLARLENGFFVFPAEAAEFAAWTGLREQLVLAQARGAVQLLNGYFVAGLLKLVDRVQYVAVNGQR